MGGIAPRKFFGIDPLPIFLLITGTQSRTCLCIFVVIQALRLSQARSIPELHPGKGISQFNNRGVKLRDVLNPVSKFVEVILVHPLIAQVLNILLGNSETAITHNTNPTRP